MKENPEEDVRPGIRIGKKLGNFGVGEGKRWVGLDDGRFHALRRIRGYPRVFDAVISPRAKPFDHLRDCSRTPLPSCSELSGVRRCEIRKTRDAVFGAICFQAPREQLVLRQRGGVEVPGFAVSNKSVKRFRDCDSFGSFGLLPLFDFVDGLLRSFEGAGLQSLAIRLSIHGAGSPERTMTSFRDAIIRELARGPVATVNGEH